VPELREEDRASGLLALGCWAPESVRCHWLPEPERPAAWQQEIDRAFADLKQQNPHVFDDPLAALRGFQEGEQLELSFSRSFYSAMAVTHSSRSAEFLEKYGPAGLSGGMACALALGCPDGFLFGRRSPTVHQGVGLWHPVAGHFNWRTHLNAAGEPDPFTCILEEAEEETGLLPAELRDLCLIAVMAHPATRKPELLFFAHTELGEVSIRQKVTQAKDRHEMDGLGFFSVDQMEDLARQGQLTPDRPATLVSQALALALLRLDLLA